MTALGPQPTREAQGADAPVWRDKKRRLWLMGLIAPTALFVMMPIVWAMNRLGWHAAAQVPLWVGPILLYILLPILDLRFGPDGQNPPDEVMEQLENDKYYRYCTYVYVPFQYLSVILGAYLFTASNLSWLGFDGALGWAGKLGVALSVGALGGVGINTAHEMGHKKESLERWLSRITLAQSCYGHFYIEHNRGHHVRVSTPEDPASARFGETFWEFLPRSVFGSLRSALRLEAQRAGTLRFTNPGHVCPLGFCCWPRPLRMHALLRADAMRTPRFGARRICLRANNTNRLRRLSMGFGAARRFQFRDVRNGLAIRARAALRCCARNVRESSGRHAGSADSQLRSCACALRTIRFSRCYYDAHSTARGRPLGSEFDESAGCSL